MKIMKLLNIVLNLFDGGAAAGGDGAGADDGGAQGGTQAIPGHTRRGKSGEYANVKFGKQAAPEDGAKSAPAAGESGKRADVTVTSDTREDKRKAYQAMIDGEFKEFYTEDTQRMINRRFKETKSLQDMVDKYQPIIDAMAQRYGVTNGDMDKLMSAIDADDDHLTAAAESVGMSKEGYKAYLKMQRENEQLKALDERRRGESQMQQQINRWYSEAEAMKAEYPDFDLNAETDNPRFLAMLKSGVPVKDAYRVMHYAELEAAAARSAAQAREKQVVENIRAKGARPAENGASSQASFTVKDDVSKLTRKDRAEVVRRAARGEHITF